MMQFHFFSISITRPSSITRPLIVAVLLLAAGKVQASDLSVLPDTIRLPDAFARQQILVETEARDLTRQATYRSLQPQIAAVDPTGHVTPIGDGETEIVI